VHCTPAHNIGSSTILILEQMLLGITCGHLKDTAAPAKAVDAKELDFHHTLQESQ
jgi:hypothetical protein